MSIDILLIGSGGREHALAWAIRQNPKCDRLWCAPGNAGIAEVADCVALDMQATRAIATLFKTDYKLDKKAVKAQAYWRTGIDPS